MIEVKSNNDRRQADIIVVGAGALGCQAAWHLRQRGLDVLVLDAAAGPALQTTQAAAGFVANFSTIHRENWQEVEWHMQQYGIEFYTHLAQNCASDIAFAASGIAYIYITAAEWEAIQPNIVLARQYGTALEILTAERAAAVLPQVRYAETTGIIFDPQSIRIRAADAIPALAAMAQAAGVRFQFDTIIEGFVDTEAAVSGVQTDRGIFHAPQVVVAAGAWSRPLLTQGGTTLAAEPRVVARYTTQSLPGIDIKMPMLMFSDSGYRFFIREENGGLLIGGADPEPLPVDRFVDADNPPPVEELSHAHAHRMRQYLRKVEHIMPVLSQAEIKDTAAGLPSYTADRRFVADAVPNRPGLYALTACNEAGVTHGPALARHLTELIVDGKTQLDRHRFAIDRF
jgi:glycine/D-amino acid oxidase-like deaminating enzyme